MSDESNRKILALSRLIDGSPTYLDAVPDTRLLWRVGKLGEENGEVVEALFGAMGENFRKGVTNGLDKVEYELLDAALASLGAVCHLHGNEDVDPLALLAAHIDKVYDRSGRPT